VTHTPLAGINDNNACTTDLCDVATGTVTHPPLAAIDDGNACTTDTCNTTTGVITHVALAAIDDGNACTTDTCDAQTGTITHPPLNTDDNNACTTDACTPLGGVTHTPISFDDNNPCTADSCNPATGVVHNPTPLNGTACNDGDACTQTDTCVAGTCTGANPVSCSASDQCHGVGTCDPGTGACSNPPKADGAACDDSNPCTQTDTCQTGLCAGGNPVLCATPDQCHTAGICDITTGTCTNIAKPNGDACDDGNKCTRTDTCQAGLCAGTDPVVCAASDQCHVAGSCDTSTGSCTNPAKSDGSACNDNSICTSGETCVAGSCTGGQALNCDDGVSCTTDSCDPVQGCKHVSTSCDAGPNPTPIACTLSAATWGAECSGGNFGCYRDLYFDAVFGSQVVIGGTLTATFTSSSAVASFLPSGGTPAALTQSYVDPPATTPDTVFAGQVLALQLNVTFHDQLLLGGPLLGNVKVSAYVASVPFGSLTVRQLLALAQNVLGGNAAALVPYGVSIATLNSVVEAINSGGSSACNLTPVGCQSDTECGGAGSELICEQSRCIPGCRPGGPIMQCPVAETCQVVSGNIGKCVQPCDPNTPGTCTFPTPVCDPGSNTCVGCATGIDCLDPTRPICNPQNTCVECTPIDKSRCKTEATGDECKPNGACGCFVDSDCGGLASERVCDDVLKFCRPGCRAPSFGNTCRATRLCSSKTAAIGQCSDANADGGIADGGATDGGTDGGGTDGGADGGKIDGGGTDGGTGQIDGGGTDDTDGGKKDSGRPGEDDESIEGGGCACNTLGSSEGRPLGAVALSALALAVLVRRRRRPEIS
jgi:MYXO-CTERM domain-containing protein